MMLARIEEQRKFLSDRSLHPQRLPRWKDLATRFGMLEEYEALYGIFSKYVHPCAWLIVKPDDTWRSSFVRAFVLHAQMYAYDLCARTAEMLGFQLDSSFGAAWNQGPSAPPAV